LGTLAHPASANARPVSSASGAGRLANPVNVRKRINPGNDPIVVWLAFEILLGLAAFGWLIWWTLPRGKRDDTPRPPKG